MNLTTYLSIPILLILAMLQTAVWPLFPLFGLVPVWTLLVVLIWSLLRGPQEGVVWGFFGGLILDIFSAGPLGLNALVLTLVALLVSFLPQWFNLNQVTIAIMATAGGTFLFYYSQAFLLQLVGISVSSAALQYAGRVALLHGILAFPLLLPLRWLEWITNPQPVQLPDL